MNNIFLFIIKNSSYCIFIILLFTSLAYAQSGIVKGVVADDEGFPLTGATVQIKGTTTGTITDFEGKYSIKASKDDVLLVSFLGFKNVEELVGNRTKIDFVLESDIAALEEVVVVGYGTVSKSDLTGAVANIKGEELNNLPSPRVDQLLQGRMAGVNITSASGAPGAATSIRIRGGNSINGDNEPLYVIDGFIAGTDFDLNSINVNDIESIDVLKDASSISIYGTRGANGVILVTTKSGGGRGVSKPTISLNAYTGVQQILRKIDFMDGPERLEWAEDFSRYTFSLPATPFDELTGNTDWQDVLTQIASISSADLSLSGSNEDVSYYFSANYFNQDGIIKNSGLERFTIRSNVDYKLNEYISLGTRLNITSRNQDNDLLSFGDLNGQLSRSLPIYPRFDEDGNYWKDGVSVLFDNPEALIDLNTNETLNTNLLGNFYIEIEPIKDLKIKSTIGFNTVWDKNNRYFSRRNTLRAATPFLGRAQISNSRRVEVLQENTITYRKKINEDHRFDVLGGFTWQTREQELFAARTDGIPNDGLAFDDLFIGDQSTTRIASAFVDPLQLASFIGRINYSLKDKYLFTVSGRMDGSSIFSGSDNQLAFFPSGAFAWRVKDERFLTDFDPISDMKFRVSYGIAGSQSADAYSTQARYLSDGYYIILNDQVASAVIRETPANPGLGWETTEQLDVGLELGFINNRLNIEFDYYYKRTRDLLIRLPLPGQTGFTGEAFQNVGSLQNTGLELLVNSVNVDKKDFMWTTTLTVSGNRSKVLDLGGLDELIVYNSGLTGPTVILEEGEPVGLFRGVEYLGTWRDQEQIDASGYTGSDALPGGPRYFDVNGDGQITPEDYGTIGNPEPLLFGGIQNTFSYKNLTLDILFQGTYGNDIYNELAIFSFFGLEDRNIYSEGVNRWTPDNTGSRIPAAGAIRSPSDVQSNSELVEDGSHLRLKNIMLSYNFNVSEIDWISNLSMYVAGSNLWLFSNFRGYDPESITNIGAVQNAVGNESNRSPYADVVRGVVRSEYPSARMVTLGLNVKF